MYLTVAKPKEEHLKEREISRKLNIIEIPSNISFSVRLLIRIMKTVYLAEVHNEIIRIKYYRTKYFALLRHASLSD